MKKSALPVVILLVAGSAALGACNSFSSADVPADVADAEADQAVIGSDGARDPDGGGRPDSPDPRPPDGCSDGTREGFVGAPGIAACEGAWSLPGILANAQPKCGRAGGNQGTKPDGTGCGADDLCASSWHVCRDAADVGAHGGALADGVCTGSAADAGQAFFATAQPSNGTNTCTPDAGADDVFGCANVASQVNGCAPLNAAIGTFQPSAGFMLGSDSTHERLNVLKFPGPGGVLCCHD